MEISAIKNIEIFYHSEYYPVIVGEAGGLLAFASIGEDERIVQRSRAFTKAIQDSFPNSDLNLIFASKLAEQIKATGRNVKITKIDRPVGNINIFLTAAFLSAPKATDHAPLALRIDTRYFAPNFTQGFASDIEVKYQLGNVNGDKELVNAWNYAGGKGETYMKFDSLLAAHKNAYEEIQMELYSLVSVVKAGMF